MKKCKICDVEFKPHSNKQQHCKKHIIRLESRDRNRELVRIRDNHTCQICFKKWKKGTRRLDVHHLNDNEGKASKAYESIEKILEIGYAITLCHKCHLNLPSEKEKISKGMKKKLSTLK